MKLYFENSRGERRLIAEPKTEETALERIRAFCDDRDYRIYYIRSWTDDKYKKWYDCGSWNEFFILENE